MHVLEKSGVRVGPKRVEFFSAQFNIRPLRDQIIVKPLAWEPSKILHVAYWGKTLRGEVLAVGPGHYPKQYSKDRSKTWDSKAFLPTDVKVGDIVELGGLEIRGYAFDEILWGDQTCVVCREADVTGVVP